ncbi:MAG TPA: hypothetical protein VII61_08955, partial [Ktedonobacteraceae bacterium]
PQSSLMLLALPRQYKIIEQDHLHYSIFLSIVLLSVISVERVVEKMQEDARISAKIGAMKLKELSSLIMATLVCVE